MSSALRSLPVPTQYYVAVTLSGEVVNHYRLSGDDWVPEAITPVLGSGVSRGRDVYRDLGMTVFYNPKTPSAGPPVDLRRVAVVTSDGLDVDQVIYIPLGTRLKGTDVQQREPVESCWVSLMAAGVAERQFGLRS
jgi:hypothetical protein